MNLRTPLIASVAVVSALGGVAAAALAFPNGSAAPEPTAAVAPSATPAPEVQTRTIRKTVHVARRDRSRDDGPSRSASTSSPVRTPVAVAAPARSFDDSGHHRSGDDDSGHHRSGDDDSGHHGGGDDSGHGRGRGRGRGGDDD